MIAKVHKILNFLIIFAVDKEKRQAMESAVKPRYELLDGLRGVAALMVILYHIGECFATSPMDQSINHGYLAVDFFFVLSGFVIGYAYDDRWSKGMTRGVFMLRRIIRLQPMVVMGVLLGVISFLVQGCEKWDGTGVSIGAVVLSFLLGLFMLPSLPGTLPEIRGNGEMFPLNGPSWSLFFEYIGSLFYALFLHRMTTKVLCAFTAASGLGLVCLAVYNASGVYHIGFGWTAADYGFWYGLVRMTFSFSIGLLMSRNFRPIRIKGIFWICSAVIVGLLSAPYIGAGEPCVLNGIYDCFCTLIVFPGIVYLAASGRIRDLRSDKICSFLGGISYPVYIIHYPFMYGFYAWVWNTHPYSADVWPVVVVMVVAVMILAWVLMKFYDIPVRRRLMEHLKSISR